VAPQGASAIALYRKAPLVQRGAVTAKRSDCDWGIVILSFRIIFKSSVLLIQSLRHGYAAPPPFAQGRLFHFATYSAISSNLQDNAVHNLSNVLVSIFSFARNLRIVLLSIPHFSRSRYVEIFFFSMVSHNLSNTIISSSFVIFVI